MNGFVCKLKKGELPSQKLSKEFSEIFNTKETFVFNIGEQNSEVHLYGDHVKNHLKESLDVKKRNIWRKK